MNKETQAIGNDLHQLSEDAQALIAATADVASDKVKEARKRLTAALERAKDMAKDVGENLRDQVLTQAKAADEIIHKYPYPSIAVGVGIGALIGVLLTRKQ